MKYQTELTNSNKNHLSIDQFDAGKQIDIKRSAMDTINKISLKTSFAYMTFAKADGGLFTLICYNPLATNLDHDSILGEAYLWIRELELKFYGQEVFN